MNKSLPAFLHWVRLARSVVVLWGAVLSLEGADSLRWNLPARTVSAQFEAAPLSRVLEQVASATGWEVYVEPGVERTVSVRFRERAPGEALLNLLGGLNFAVIPQPGKPSRLLVFDSLARNATELRRARPSSLIPNELIVTLNPESGETIDNLAARLGGQVVGRADELNSYRLRFENEEAAQAARDWLASNPETGSAESNYRLELPDGLEGMANRPPAAFPLTPTVNSDGSVIVVGLIDTAIQPLDPARNDFLLPSIHVAGEPLPSGDHPLHGTSMADTILQSLAAANETGDTPVRVLPIDIYGPHSETTSFDLARGLYAALDAGATVVNLSVGGDADSPFVARLIHEGHQQGVLFFGAAGNQPTGEPFYPAAYPPVVSVTAADRRGQVAPYANHGEFVDVMAPGSVIVRFQDQNYFVVGTSTATAIVSGAAAAARAEGKLPSEVEALIRQTLALPQP